MYCKTIFIFLVDDTTLAIVYVLETIFSKKCKKIIMVIDYKIRGKTSIWYWQWKKISALSSDTTDKYKYLTGEKIWPFDQSTMID